MDGGLGDIDHDERDIVLLDHGRWLPMANLGEQLLHQLRLWARLILADNLLELVVAKGLAAGILGFGHAIGIKQKAVAWIDGHLKNGVVGLGYHPEKQAVAFDALQFVSA